MATGRRGRPVGWRKPDAFTANVMVRLPTEQAKWLWAERGKTKRSMSEIVRRLIDDEMKREAKRRRLK